MAVRLVVVTWMLGRLSLLSSGPYRAYYGLLWQIGILLGLTKSSDHPSRLPVRQGLSGQLVSHGLQPNLPSNGDPVQCRKLIKKPLVLY